MGKLVVRNVIGGRAIINGNLLLMKESKVANWDAPVNLPNVGADLSAFLPYMWEAVKNAENAKNNGILSFESKNPDQDLWRAVNNNYNRWESGKQPAPWIEEKPKKYVDFMRRRYAPLKSEGSTNDKNNKNINWAPNVRAYLKKKLGPERYEYLKKMNFVQSSTGGIYG
jgi:hypothetical protein